MYLTAADVRSCKESCLHINVLEMLAVMLALAAFLPQLSGQSVVLMSHNTTVVMYLIYPRRHCLVGVVPHDGRDCLLDRALQSFSDSSVYSWGEECSGRLAQSSQPGPSNRVVPLAQGGRDDMGVPILTCSQLRRMPSCLFMSLLFWI